MKFQNALSTLGEVLCGDEKLFYFTGSSGMVRTVPSKPARVGIWHYQACVFLENNLPFLVFTRAHSASTSLDMHVQTATIVSEWAAIIERKERETILVMDSYYLDSAGRHLLREKGISYIAALKPSRFKEITSILKPHVTSSGQSAFMYNRIHNEACTYHWSMDNDVGKKFVISNAFKVTNRKKKRGGIPIYDAYNASFSACDKFNHMKNRTWPFRCGGRSSEHGVSADKMNCWDYYFTATLFNTWHLFLQKEGLVRKEKPWKQFTEELAIGIIRRIP